ncbi:dienelactone hydrolase family protein [Aliidiomarina indica]|uniref:dienelactone hydrolase family protein n=1 Tax=Aliidiomarina indica TaxID=2749147 RepID=UPI001890B0EE|nr:dienelactone hydrolase family protein [Aliidiomarina indica]
MKLLKLWLGFIALSMVSCVLLTSAAQAGLVGESYVYEIDGIEYEGYVAYNSRLEQSLGTVMIVHDWSGPDDYEKARADQLAALGYTAFAIDVYGRDRQPTSVQENQQRAAEMYQNREEFRNRLMAGLAEIANIPGGTDNVVVIGYCFGGAAVLEMARAGAKVQGFVSFHGGLSLPDGQNYADVTAPILILHGSADPVTGSKMDDLAALLDALNEAGVSHNAHVYGGARHSFTVPWSSDYHLDADRASWQQFQQFLKDTL